MSLIYSAESEPSHLDSKEPGCDPSPSARPTNGANAISPGTGQPSRAFETFVPWGLNRSPPWVQSTLFVEDSPAKTSAKPEKESASKDHAADCGATCCGWCMGCDPIGYSLRMSLLSATAAMTGCTPTWRRLVTPAGHSWWQLSTSELRRNASEHGLWQTPTTRDYKGQSGLGNRTRRGKNGKLHVANLCDQLVDSGRPDLVRSPTFREWLMGLPIGFTDSRPSGTPSFQLSQKSSVAPSCDPCTPSD